MNLVNCVGFETRHGYRTFELYEGDLTNADAAADVLIVSAFAGGYMPLHGTLLGALFDVWQLDLRRVGRQIDFCERARV